MENKEAIERAKSIAAKLESKNQGILLASFDTSLQDNFLCCTTQSINQSIISLSSAGAAVSPPKSSKRSREDGSSGSGSGSGSGRGSSGKTVTKKMYVPVKQYPHANFVGYVTLLLPPYEVLHFNLY